MCRVGIYSPVSWLWEESRGPTPCQRLAQWPAPRKLLLRDLQQLAKMVKWAKMPGLLLALCPQADGLPSLGLIFLMPGI